MLELYNKLIELQKETKGAMFLIGFSKTKNKHSVKFPCLNTIIESDTIESAIQKAIDYIVDNRIKRVEKFTLYN